MIWWLTERMRMEMTSPQSLGLLLADFLHFPISRSPKCDILAWNVAGECVWHVKGVTVRLMWVWMDGMPDRLDFLKAPLT